MDVHSGEKHIENCAVKLHILSCTIIIITICRSPKGNVANFLNNLEAALNQVYNNTVDIILCGDFNINYLDDNQNKQDLNSPLNIYNIYSLVDFPTRIYNNLHTMIDNIFINKFKNENYTVSPLINGLSDHDAQLLNLFNITISDDNDEFYFYRRISKHLLDEFQTSLSYEMWENIFNNNDDDTNTLYNNFLNTFLRIFCISFPKARAKLENNPKDCLTNGIKISCSTKRKLYLLCKESNDAKLKAHYNKYWKIQSSVIILAKKCMIIIN
jgi:hypothetical protein